MTRDYPKMACLLLCYRCFKHSKVVLGWNVTAARNHNSGDISMSLRKGSEVFTMCMPGGARLDMECSDIIEDLASILIDELKKEWLVKSSVDEMSRYADWDFYEDTDGIVWRIPRDARVFAIDYWDDPLVRVPLRERC